MTTEKAKRPPGRPKKATHGKNVWVPDHLLPVVAALKEAAKKDGGRKQ